MGTSDSPEASDSVFRFLILGAADLCCAGGVGCEDCRAKAFGEARGFELAFGGGGVVAPTALARAASAELGLCPTGVPVAVVGFG